MRISIGSAAVLGLKDIKQNVKPTTCYLLIGEQCHNACMFCSQNVSGSMVSRITWPEFPEDEIINKINISNFRRVCLQCTSTGIDKVIDIAQKIMKPTSISYNFKDLTEIRMAAAHADNICIPIDVANRQLFRQIKGSDFDERLRLITEAAEEFPKKIVTHVIVGLGENEAEIVDLLAYLNSLQVTVGLFAFHPIKGTPLENRKKPDLEYYRRIQAFFYKIKHHTNEVSPDAFMTTGCPHCNRPYFNENPRGPFYNYPRRLNEEEIKNEMAFDFRPIK